ncbi:ATP-binding protein [Nonomuraea pusilla]|uniref:Anti-sigma regulatory factor (Ser/Thr protein kinase) n=1 Tax=Nonomuraea pusilla TaxID=46177 RepID=A0A1H8DA08_9ACTN|nr:ATP-binding protein [Nonomuraea pusilla]SEN04079.1 Anti-sigma regulatory factor (Ser/Thr protein kinase) [Nonomuraea pusilla]
MLNESRIRATTTRPDRVRGQARQGGTRHAWPLPADARSVREARAVVRHELSGLGLAPDVVDDAVLMASELVTNALLYGEPPYELALHLGAEEIMCVVVDASPLPPSPLTHGPAHGPAEHAAEHGRGLRIVAALSDGFHGFHPQRYVTRPDLVGKATWFALPREERRAEVVPFRRRS